MMETGPLCLPMGSESESCSVMSASLWPHGLYTSWNSLGQNTGVGSLSLLQGIFPSQGSNPCLSHCRWILYHLSHQGSPYTWIFISKMIMGESWGILVNLVLTWDLLKVSDGYLEFLYVLTLFTFACVFSKVKQKVIFFLSVNIRQ